MESFKTKEFLAGIYRKITDELTPAERKAILIVIFLLAIGTIAKIISSI